MSIITTLQDRFYDWTMALFEHIQISMLSVLIAIVIAIPLAIVIREYPRIKAFMLQMTGVFQTIPSLALLGLFIPFIGIGKKPAIVALVIYAIFPILQNTVTGFEQIPPNLEEASEAFGMTKKEKLFTYQIPLAMPIIVSGIRTTTVLIIGTATLAALVGAGGMGSFILLGIDRNDSALILIGAISSALLAMVFNFLLKWVSKLSLRKIGMVFLAVALITCGSFFPKIFMDGKSDQLTIAGKLGSEPEILMNMYKYLIEEETDMSVNLKPNFGKTSFLYGALKSKEIDIYPEFTGTVVTSILTDKYKNQISNDQEDDKNNISPEKKSLMVYNQAKEGIYKQDKLVLLKPMKYQNTYALAVSKDFAQKYDIDNISDLKKVEDKARAGFSLEFADRKDGGKGLETVYGLNLSVSTMEPSLKYSAIRDSNIDIVEVYSTDSEIREYDLKVLKDDKGLFPPYQGSPMMREETIKKHPELKKVLEKLSGKITEEEMSRMNYEVKVSKKSAKEVAKKFLMDKNLIKKQKA